MTNRILNQLAWQKISNPKWDENPRNFVVTGLPYRGVFKNDALGGFDYECEGKRLTLKPVAIGFDGKYNNAQSSNGLRKGNKIFYKKVFGDGIHIEIEIGKTRWKKKIKIDSLSDLNIPENAEFLEIKFEIETDFDIEGWDKNNKLEFTKAIKLGQDSQIESIKSWDSSPKVSDENGYHIDKQQTHIGILSKENGKLYLTKKIPVDWLKRAVFPIWTDVEISFGSKYMFATKGWSASFNSCSKLDSTHFVVAYEKQDRKAYARIGVISDDDVISYGTEVEFNYISGGFTQDISCVALDSTHFVIAYYSQAGDGYSHAKIGTVSNGDEITFGAEYDFYLGAANYIDIDRLDNTHFVIVYNAVSIIGTVSNGDEIAFGSEYAFTTESPIYMSCAALDATHFVVEYTYNDGSWHGACKIGVVSSGDEITFGAEYQFNAAATYYGCCAALDATHFVVGYRDFGNSSYGTAQVGVVSSGDEISYGSKYVFNAAATGVDERSIVCAKLDTTHFVMAYEDDGGDDYGCAKIGIVASDDEISYTAEAIFNEAVTTRMGCSGIDATHFIIVYKDDGGDDDGEAIIGTYTIPTENTTNFFKAF